MLKEDIPMNELEMRAAGALRQLLEKIPTIEIEGIEHERPSSQWEPDIIAHVHTGGRHHLLICEFKSNGQPRYARTALLELRDYVTHRAPQASAVFMAPYISPAVRQLCEQYNVGYLDLEGNARIAFESVFIERTVSEKPVVEQRELKSLFKPKSAQVLRTMLREPSRAWRVTELATISKVSLGHVSNVRAGLLDREWANVSEDGLFLSAPDELLNAWRENYTAPAGERMRFYTPLHGSTLEEAARSALGDQGNPGHAAFASFSAAHWLAPYGRTGMHYFFADPIGLGRLQSALKLSPSTKGENVHITIAKDDGLLADTVEPAPGAVCTSPIQTYLDLSIAGERGEEAAEHLRRERLSWPK
jgi:hypothetical protein